MKKVLCLLCAGVLVLCSSVAFALDVATVDGVGTGMDTDNVDVVVDGDMFSSQQGRFGNSSL